MLDHHLPGLRKDQPGAGAVPRDRQGLGRPQRRLEVRQAANPCDENHTSPKCLARMRTGCGNSQSTCSRKMAVCRSMGSVRTV